MIHLVDLNLVDLIGKDPYNQHVQYPSVKAGIQAHAETYSFNIESELFNQLTKEQQKLWRKEIEQACISGGEAGVGLARDSRYKENLVLKEDDLDLITGWFDHIAQIADDRMTLTNQRMTDAHALDEIKCLAKNSAEFITKYYKAQKGEQNMTTIKIEDKIEDIFDEFGNFINPLDPYRCEKDNEVYQYLFDENGYSLRTKEAREFIRKHNCSPFSDIVKYYYASDIDSACKGNYNAVYAWR